MPDVSCLRSAAFNIPSLPVISSVLPWYIRFSLFMSHLFYLIDGLMMKSLAVAIFAEKVHHLQWREASFAVA